MPHDTVKVMNYDKAKSILLINENDIWKYLADNVKDLIGKYLSHVGAVESASDIETARYSISSTHQISEIKSSIVWNLCFTDESYYYGSVFDKVDMNAWDESETNITFFPDEEELHWTVVSNDLVDKVHAAMRDSEEEFRAMGRYDGYKQSLEQLQVKIEKIRGNTSLRLSYWHDF